MTYNGDENHVDVESMMRKAMKKTDTRPGPGDDVFL